LAAARVPEERIMGGLRTYRVEGMTCEGCVRAVTNALRKTNAEAQVQVDLMGGTVAVTGIGSDEQVRTAVERAGFEYRGPVGAQ
jgi:copper chaperone